MESSPQGYLIYRGNLTDIPYHEAMIGYILFSIFAVNVCFKMLGMTLAAFKEDSVYFTYLLEKNIFIKILLLCGYPLYLTFFAPLYYGCIKYFLLYGRADRIALVRLKDKESFQKLNLQMHIKSVIIAFILIGGSVMLAHACDVGVSDVSVWFVLLGSLCFVLYEIILQNGVVNSDNFMHQLEKCRQIQFRIVRGYDESAKAFNGIAALLPYTFLFVISPIMNICKPNEFWFKPYVVCGIIALYMLCCIRTLLTLIGLVKHRVAVMFIYVLQVATVLAWFLSSVATDILKSLNVFVMVLAILILFWGSAYYWLHKLLSDDNARHLDINVPFRGDPYGNYFIFEMKDGTVYDSRNRLFYPLIQEGCVRLLFVNGDYVMRAKRDIKCMIIKGFPKFELWIKESEEVCRHFMYLPNSCMVIEIPGKCL